jgi:Flp pilus assembly protein TadG
VNTTGRDWIRRLCRLGDESGQTVIVAALCMTVLMGLLALAIDAGELREAKRQLQFTADAAAIAAGLEIRVCGTTSNCPAMQAAAQNALVENGLAGGTSLSNCASITGAGLTMVVNNPPCALGSADPNTGNTSYVEVVVSQQQQTNFASILGFNNVPITVRAEAGRGSGPCIYALDPSGPGAIAVLAGLGIASTCAVVDESSSSSALTCVVGALISAPKISVTGGTSGLLCGSNPPPLTGVKVPNPADPLAYLPAPSTATAACGSSTASPYFGSASIVNIALLGGTKVFNPGVYCGGISITAAVLTNITFNPGIYILKQGPGPLGPLIPTGGLTITLSALSTIQGQGVMFYNEGTVGAFSITAPAALGLSNFNLSAPTSGTYGGMLFFQAHGTTAQGTFLLNLLQGSELQGAIYEPDAVVSYGVSAVSTSYNILVAKDLQFPVAVLSVFGSNYASLASGSPLYGDTAILVQ